MVFILDTFKGALVKSEIIIPDAASIPLKKDGWKFNWKQLSKSGKIYVLRTMDSPHSIEGALCLRIEYEMLIMDALELAPHNVGHKDKRYDYVAGCLIAFGCRESFKITGEYRGFLTFVSKTKLIRWYAEKYGAELALGQRLYIDWDKGEELIEKYLNRKSKE